MATLLRPRALDARIPRSLVDVTPTKAQRRVIEGNARAMLVLGDAGHGKTTLALLVLAERWRRSRGRFRGLVVVPTDGLRVMIEDALAELGVPREAARVRTYDRWALWAARRAFPDLPRRTGRDATPATLRLKRDPAIAQAVGAIAARPPGRIDDDEDRPDAMTPACAQWGDLQHLFGDEALLAEVVERSRARVPRHAIAETIAHTKVQFSLRTEVAWSHVIDRARLDAVDGARLDAGTPTADAGSLDAEDCAVLFAIDRTRAQRLGLPPVRPRRVDCLVLDEAQELAEIELGLLARCVRPGGTLVVAGDADQHLTETTSFVGWTAAMRALGAEDHQVVQLDHGFRCPPAVVSAARAARDGWALDDTPIGDEVLRLRGLPDVARWLDDASSQLREHDPKATLAVLCRDDAEIRTLAAAMSLPVPVACDGRFPKRGAVLARLDQVRGLEFDFVVIPALERYDDTPAARRALYVAMTRTRHQLALIGR